MDALAAISIEPSVSTGQAVHPFSHGQNVPQRLVSDTLLLPSQSQCPTPMSGQAPSHASAADQAKSAAVDALEELLKAHTQPLQDEQNKAKAAMAAAQEHASRLVAEIGVE
ncbi:hypothetical protein PG993_010798 [Apiospora rasikravindrae]|uniref:Uncharacterized protein n=1 Tax=Apiospora rasikravindrae TaxID=990691 RepID=A0ABR1SCE8_9PEZI